MSNEPPSRADSRSESTLNPQMHHSIAIGPLVASRLPFTFGRYELQEIIGEGGSARVFRAELRGPAGFRKPVALKAIKPEIGGRSNEREILDLVREACLVGRLKHPHIVDVYELGEWQGDLFLSMELVDGVTLSQLIRANHSIPVSVVLEIAIALAAGLAKAHAFHSEGRSAGLVHRDLKPSNILLSWDGAVKIADFGIAITKETHPDPEQEGGGLFGTPDYMSPEQVQGKQLDGRSDIFSLGLVIASMVLGKNPLANRVVIRHLFSGLPLEAPLLDGQMVSALDQTVSGLGHVVLRCLEPDREQRYPDAEQLGEALQVLLTAVTPVPRFATWIGKSMGGDANRTLTQNPSTYVEDGETEITASTVNFHPKVQQGNLGPPLDSFVGRQSDLTEIARLFENGARLVTVKGPGGAGKTRVCRNHARRVGPDLEGGAWFVDLTETRNAMGVLQATALALGVPLGRAVNAEELVVQLGHAIARKGRTLLILDNCEQVADQVSSTVENWMDLAPGVLFLATSRESLRMDGEHLFLLEALVEEDGVELFEIRAAVAGARIDSLKQHRSAVQRIVRELDGLPLAIELAAARGGLLSPVQILDRLSERFELLRTGRRDLSLRQTSLRSLIDWSWELLEPWEQSALGQLSTFHGGFTMDAAETVLDLSPWSNAPWSLDIVGSLLDKSLLYSRVVLGQPRFGMYVSIRAYAEEKLALDNPPVSGREVEHAVKMRHAALYAEYGSEAFRGSLDLRGGMILRRLFVLELENLMAGVDVGLEYGDLDIAAACALAAGEIYKFQGPLMDGVAVFERVLAQPVCDETRFALLKKLAWLRQAVGSRDEAVSIYEDAMAIAQESGDRQLVAKVMSSLAETYRAMGRLDESLRAFEQALALTREFGERQNEGLILGNLALLLESQGRDVEALDCYQEALVLHREFGVKRLEASVVANLAKMLRRQGKYDESYQGYQQALVIIREVGDRGRESMVLGNIANERVRIGEFETALQNYEESIALAREFGNPFHESSSLGNLGDLLFNQGDYAGASRRFTQAIGLADPAAPYIAGVFRGSLALLRALQGDFVVARTLLVEGEPQVRGIDKFEFGKFLCKKARVLHLAGQLEDARDAIEEAEVISDDLGGAPDSELNVLVEETKTMLSA